MDEAFTIQISSNLVDRLADDGERLKKKTKKSKRQIPREHQRPQSKVHEKQITDDSETHKGTTATGWPLRPPMFLPVTSPAQSVNPEVDEVQSVLQESERVVERLQKQEENMVHEVTQRAKDLPDKEFKLPYQKPVPCLAEMDAFWTCYKEYVKEPLKCAPVVKSYADCVRRVRQEVRSADK